MIIEFLNKKHDFALYSKYIQVWLQIIKPPIHTYTYSNNELMVSTN